MHFPLYFIDLIILFRVSQHCFCAIPQIKVIFFYVLKGATMLSENIISGQNLSFIMNTDIYYTKKIPLRRDRQEKYHFVERAKDVNCLTNYYRNYEEKPVHCHDYYEIEICIAGEADHFINGEVQHMSKGSAAFIAPNTYHYYKNTTNYVDMFTLMFIPSDNSSQITSLFQTKDNPHKPIVIQLSRLCFERVSTLAGVASNIFYHTNNMSLFSQTFQLILNVLQDEHLLSPNTQNSKDPFLKKVEEYVERNISKKINLQDVAEYVCLESKYVSAKFKSLKKENLVHYINRKRIGYAQNMLVSSDLKIINISQACGFENLSNFNRIFKHFCKCSPREYKNQSNWYNQNISEIETSQQ